MSLRITTLVLLLLGALFAGCKAGTSLHGAVDIASWTPVLEATAVTGAGENFDLVGTGGVVDDDALWTIDLALQLGRASGREVRAQTLNFGYLSHRYSGNENLDLSFAGKALMGDTATNLSMSIFKFTYGEPQAASGGGNNRTEGSLGLHYMDFAVRAKDSSGTTAYYSGNAPMFVVGWKIAYSDRAMVYFANIEGMDLDVIPIENVRGEVMDYSAGVRWSVGGNVALTIAYREYMANLDDRGEEMKIKLAGAYFSLFVMW
jgi:hypothetical protein